MRYLLDTLALIRHFANIGHIGHQATAIFAGLNQSEDVLFISVISLMEVLYLAEKHLPINLPETLGYIESSNKYIIVDLTPDILKVAESIQFYELHDRLILATAKWLDIRYFFLNNYQQLKIN